MAQVAGRTLLRSLTAVNCLRCLEPTNILYQCENASCHIERREKSVQPSSPVYHSSLLSHNSTAADRHQHAAPPIHVVSVAKQCPVMDGWAFGLQQRAATVTIIHTLEDWRVIELCPVMEFLHLCIWKLKFTFAYRKWCLIHRQRARMVPTVLSPFHTYTISSAFLTPALMKTKGINQFFSSDWHLCFFSPLLL